MSYRWGAIIVNSKLGSKVFISKNSFISNSFIGNYSSVGRNTTIINTDLGRFCSISWNVTIGATQHPFDHISTHAFSYIKRFGFVKENKRIISKTFIGNDVWFGANSIVMPGIKIGNGAVIGAGSIVTKDVPDYAIVAGVPAKIMKFRFSEDVIKKLLDYQWWNLLPSAIKGDIKLWQTSLNSDSLERLKAVCKF